ncbi:MAG: alpha amylase C-terminal domain-containing protein [Candidatus Gastranaerophilales bacterium]|nr:alpha amylase C-terminal domain-containing protein [Candidatus Gastranaerophilales bacterium]
MKIDSIIPVSNKGLDKTKEKLSNRDIAKSYKQMDALPNVYQMPISFTRKWSEHTSWGAVINPKTKETIFKILTYPDSKKVIVTVVDSKDETSKKTYELTNMGEGVFATKEPIPAGEVKHGDKYSYTIYKGDGNVDTVKDPYSFRQMKLLGESVVYDHSRYRWRDSFWFNEDKHRISRVANRKNQLTPVSNARIYELNIATLTKDGTYESTKSVLQSIKRIGFNAIEIMPVENTYSFNWGYDGVDKFAPAEHRGGPDQLKELIDYAHSIGLNVIMDMVPNHLGPDGASLKKTGPYIQGQNDFGESFNFEGKNSRYVRDYIVNSALNWLANYHCDGLRLDMTKYMQSDYTMKQIAAEVNYHFPDAFLIAEDSREKISVDDFGNYWDNPGEVHDKRVVNSLLPFEYGESASQEVHCEAIEDICRGKTSLGRLGYDSEWDFNYHHCLEEGLYGVINLDRFEKACYCSQNAVKYVMSHDEIGNREGTRLIAKLMVPMLHLNENIILDENDHRRVHEFASIAKKSMHDAKRSLVMQKAQFVAEHLAIMYQTGKLDRYNTANITNSKRRAELEESFIYDILMPLGIKSSSGVTYDAVKETFMKSFDKNKMALARTYSIPGPKMVFQGDEKADLTPFRFFRQFESVRNEHSMHVEKGYDTGLAAYNESKMGSISYATSAKDLMNKFKRLTKDLNQLNVENPALARGYLLIDSTIKNPDNVFATHAYDPQRKNEVFSVTNFADLKYPRQGAAKYYIQFPQGVWIEKLNTDDKKYGGSGNINGKNEIYSDGSTLTAINLSGSTTAIFARIR